MENQTYLFIIFILNGFLIGILFDMFRILRKSFKTGDIVTCIEDTIFWILTAFIILYSVFKFNNGKLRAYIFLGIIFGFSIYMLLFSKIFITINVYIIKILKKIFYYIFILPLKSAYKIVKKIMVKPTKFFIINIKRSLSKIIKKSNNLFNKKKKKNYKKDFN